MVAKGGQGKRAWQVHRWPGLQGLPEARKAVGAAAGLCRWLKPESARIIRCRLNLLRC